MFNKKEIGLVVITTLILAFTISLRNLGLFLWTILAVFIAIMINIISKKIISYKLDTEIEIDLLELQKFGVRPHQHFKKPAPIGLILPFIVMIISAGYFTWMGSLIFNVKSKIHRTAKRFGLYKFSEITEHHTGLIATSGVIANLIFALIGYIIGFSIFAKVSIYLAFFNMIPISNMDGNKIYFGNILIWSVLAAITLIALAYTIFLP